MPLAPNTSQTDPEGPVPAFHREETVEELCVCSKRMLDIEHAAWVFRGRPCCNGSCYRNAVEADDRKMALRNLARRQEEARHAAL